MWQISIDTGGTFTDCLGLSPNGHLKRLKILSSSNLRGLIIKQLDDRTFKGLFNWHIQDDIFKDFEFEVLGSGEKSLVKHVDLNESIIRLQSPIKIDKTTEFQISSNEEVPVLAARVLTSTPLNTPLPALVMRLGSTRGTNALLERKGADVLFITTQGFKDLIRIGNQQRPELFALNIIKPDPLYKNVIEVNERIDRDGNIIQEIDHDSFKSILTSAQKNVSVAIAFMNSYKNPTHEKELESFLLNNGFEYVSRSSSLSSNIKILPRAETAIANAYLLPIIDSYIRGIEKYILTGRLHVMTSAGAVVNSKLFTPKDSLLSGPAGGIVGAKTVAEKSGFDKILTFDMGGTSTDVAVYNAGYDYQYETKVGDAHILSPCLSIETIAAGGGSICSYTQGVLTVGPESAGAMPGPACYGAGGPLTITDLNLLCGRLEEKNFSIPLNKQRAEDALKDIMDALRLSGSRPDKSELLNSFLAIANEKMAEAIKKVSVRKGYEPKNYTLVTYGGAGGQHSCAIAELLDIPSILIPYDAGLLSAYGISEADIEAFAEKQLLMNLNTALNHMSEWWAELQERAYSRLQKQGIAKESIHIKKKLAYLRYRGQENTVEIEVCEDGDYYQDFKHAYEKIYGHWLEGQSIEVESIKLIASSKKTTDITADVSDSEYTPKAIGTQQCLTNNGWKEADVYIWEELKPGARIHGPAIIVSQNCTVFVEMNWQFFLDRNNHAIMNKASGTSDQNKISTPEAASIELFKNRFIGIVEEMGALLERTSFSVNVKERLDFSCALLDAAGELIVNAPHIPVHLGSMGICVRKVREQLPIEEGDVIITNHPAYGGSHLPDITLISGAFENGALVGYVANRAHHAEIGGKTPGSMPIDATQLDQEGVIIEPRYLAQNGVYYWDEIKDMLNNAAYPSRAVDENIADLKGGVAALQAGINGLKNLCTVYSIQEVKQHMYMLKDYVSSKLLQKVVPLYGQTFTATELLDDGSKLQVSIDINKDKITFDFAGTGEVHHKNLNATEAIVTSVVLYVLRLLMDEDLPLNEGLLQNVKIKIPYSILNPDFEHLNPPPAVVGGNTEISQRLTDTLLKALNLSACSQGTMNNLLFGDDTFGYYETICGGTGAGKGFNGQDAVHQHMTNTRITDPEIMEWRYPVRLNKFEIRKDSGGNGKWHGGDGIIREITFLKPLEMTILSQHRIQKPYGLEGGEKGECGEQFIMTKSGTKQVLKGIDSRKLNAGDKLIVKTPGGGGYGKV
ncbi:hydantoinase B/oxoprolinase family protein [Fulvivirga sp. 29W222]|uniref:Hydantoinase B/oxoprolinase family protein n=1 Tax=Fulvivirga marina TaxID=2494733 RepID=A0A937KH08_9BACT|nr:hydantoinase B/oxoprolinase family protein [Fulvivirga marina]MBL6449718.1 hydantoinase B/oxoprolinase family protein [Fulvivirga marina]